MKAEKFYSDVLKELGGKNRMPENEMIAEDISYILDAMKAVEICWQTENITNKTYIEIMEKLAGEIENLTEEFYKNKEAE